MDTKKSEPAVSQKEAVQQTLKIAAAKAQTQNHGVESPAMSPRTKLPVEHAESQAVERIHNEMQTSLNSAPRTEAQADGLLKEGKKKEDD